jgi:hypothetical protein
VPEELWATATNPEEKGAVALNAMAEVNKLAPGCILANPVTSLRLAELMLMSRCWPGGKGARMAQALTRVLLPHVPRGKAGGLTIMHVWSFPDIYTDVVTVRTVYNGLLKSERRGTELDELKRLMPGLRKVGQDDLNAIISLDSKTDPKRVAAQFIGRELGYGATSVIQAVDKFLPGYEFRSFSRVGRDRGRMIIDAKTTDQLHVPDFENLWGVGCPKCGWKMEGENSPLFVTNAKPMFALCGSCGARLDPDANCDEELLLPRPAVSVVKEATAPRGKGVKRQRTGLRQRESARKIGGER